MSADELRRRRVAKLTAPTILCPACEHEHTVPGSCPWCGLADKPGLLPQARREDDDEG